MNSFLLWVGGLLVAVLGLLFAAPLVIDWNSYRGVLEEEASRVLGRDVRIGGRVNLRLLPSPYVRFEKVRISDAGAALGEPFFRAEAFTLWLAPTPLLRGAIEATELELDKPILRLAIDAEGRGNWQAVRITPGSVPFVPSDVILQQVRVRQGIVSLKTPGTPEPLALSGIDGELAASSLDGPFRFRGTVEWYGLPRDLRIGTAQREPDGKLRYKASVRAVDSSTQYVFDGILSEMSAKARNSGTITAKLPLASLMPVQSGGRARGVRGNEAVDLTAAFDGDLDGVKLDNISFSFEQDGKPQSMSGIAAASWRNGLRTEARLASRWLDLDQLAGLSPGGNASANSPAGADTARPPPVDLLRRLIGHVSEVLPRDGSSLLTIDVDQVNLGGAALANARLALARAGGLTSIGELKATFPGNTRGELRGTIRPAAQEAGQQTADIPDVLDGELNLRGGSYQRFGAWAGAGGMLPSGPGTDSPFSLSTKLVLAPESVALTNTSLEVAGKPARGALTWSWGKTRWLSIEAEGRAIDIGAFAPGALDLTIAGGSAAANAPRAFGVPVIAVLAERVAAINRGVGELKLQLRAGEISDGLTSLRDVEADIDVGLDRIAFTRLSAGDRGFARVELDGALTNVSTQPAGLLRGWITTETANGLSGLVRLLPDGGRSAAQNWLQSGAKLDTALTLQIGAGPVGAGLAGSKPDDRLTLTATGSLDADRHDFSLVLDGGPSRWRDAPVALVLKLDGPTTANVARRLVFADTGSTRSAGDRARAATLAIEAAGANARSLVASARLDALELGQATYRGTASVTAGGGIDLGGDVAFIAASAAEVAAFLMAGKPPAIAGSAISGNVAVERTAGAIGLSSANFDVGGTKLKGVVRLTEPGGRSRIDATITAGMLDVPTLVGFAVDGSAATVGSAEAGNSPWPDTPFAMTRFAAVEGQITVSAPVARLSADLALDGAEARIGLSPGRVELTSLTGAALGGRFTARGTLERADAGATVSLEARLIGAMLDRLTGNDGGRRTGEQAVPAGAVNLTAAATGRSLSPRAALAAMTGKGEIEFRGARASGISPSLIERIAEAALSQGEDITRERLLAITTAERARGDLSLGNRKLPIEIADGVARIGALEIATDEATMRNTTVVDLLAMQADSEWRITPRRPWKPKQSTRRGEPLSAMTFVWSGAIGTIARQPPRVTIDGLERDLGLRRIEGETEKLEELRRQDEDRVRIEQQRSQEQGNTQPTTNPAPNPAPTQTGAPVIEAPFQIQVRPAGTEGAPVAPSTAPTQPTRIIRPPPSRPPSQTNQRTLQDIINGQ